MFSVSSYFRVGGIALKRITPLVDFQRSLFFTPEGPSHRGGLERRTCPPWQAFASEDHLRVQPLRGPLGVLQAKQGFWTPLNCAPSKSVLCFEGPFHSLVATAVCIAVLSCCGGLLIAGWVVHPKRMWWRGCSSAEEHLLGSRKILRSLSPVDGLLPGVQGRSLTKPWRAAALSLLPLAPGISFILSVCT